MTWHSTGTSVIIWREWAASQEQSIALGRAVYPNLRESAMTCKTQPGGRRTLMLSRKPGILDVLSVVAYVVRHWNRVKDARHQIRGPAGAEIPVLYHCPSQIQQLKVKRVGGHFIKPDFDACWKAVTLVGTLFFIAVDPRMTTIRLAKSISPWRHGKSVAFAGSLNSWSDIGQAGTSPQSDAAD